LPGREAAFLQRRIRQHIASSERFDDEFPLDITLEEAKKYYANIVLAYGAQVQKALESGGWLLPIETLPPATA